MPMTQVSILTALDHIDSAIKFQFGGIEPKHLGPGEGTDYPGHERAAQHIKCVVDDARKMLMDGSDRRETVMRRLAFCQGWIWTMGIVSIDDLKDANRPPDE